ncbi:MAG: winged helix-turn-helix domain-containing protein [Planctomycetes bacterium]|nr:winged helix-turn-helix domain-containing protein [Planctomycetota bacterium]
MSTKKTAKAPKATKAAKPAAKKAGKPQAEAKPKKLSAIDAAAKVLAGAKEPLTTKQLIEAMASKGLWTSPGGKTPHATLYSAILREIATKGKEARFKKTERGHFAANG